MAQPKSLLRISYTSVVSWIRVALCPMAFAIVTNALYPSVSGLNTVKVRVTNVAVEHEVLLKDFTNWLDRTGGSPREVMDRKRIKSILGMQD